MSSAITVAAGRRDYDAKNWFSRSWDDAATDVETQTTQTRFFTLGGKVKQSLLELLRSCGDDALALEIALAYSEVSLKGHPFTARAILRRIQCKFLAREAVFGIEGLAAIDYINDSHMATFLPT